MFLGALALAAYVLLVPQTLGHMEMSWPYPLRSKFNPDTPKSMIDYSMTAPLEASGSNYPCKGYQNDVTKPVSMTYTAGSTYNMSLAGTAVHGGGSCQLSLSYDNGQTFKVIKSMIGGCPLTSTYDFMIPSSAPSGDALFAWTWQNKLGNREFYMNCAAVTIASRSTQRHRYKHRREGVVSVNSLPGVWKANLESVNSCTTSEGEEPIYPNPGPEVQYGDGISSSDAPTPGDCDGAVGGKTYASLSSADSAAAASSSPAAQFSSATASSGGSPAATSSAAAQPFAGINRNGNGAPSSSQTTLLSTSLAAYTIATSTNSATSATQQTSAAAPAYSNTTSSYSSSSSSDSSLSYAKSSGLSTYTPCVPGTFLCTSATKFYTCASSSSYIFPRNVASGMTCIPNLSLSSNAAILGAVQQGNTAAGSYRDDRYVRAQSNGACRDAGAVRCTNGGQGFEACSQGAWMDMGAVPAGMSCAGGRIAASR